MLVTCISPGPSSATGAGGVCTLSRSARQRLEDMVLDLRSLYQDAADGFQMYTDNWYRVKAAGEASFNAFIVRTL